MGLGEHALLYLTSRVAPSGRTPVLGDVEHAPNTQIVHTDRFTPFAYDRPRSLQNMSNFCVHLVDPVRLREDRLDNRDWRFCTGQHPRKMNVHVVLQKHASFDRGLNLMGATFDAQHTYLMAHAHSPPALHGKNVRRYAKLAQALAPYAAEAQSHFWFGTVQNVLTLYDALPSDVPIVVAWSPALERAYAMLKINQSRLIHFDRSATYHGHELYSVVPSPWGADGQGGEPTSAQSLVRLRVHMKPIEMARTAMVRPIVLVSRGDRRSRRCTTHAAIRAALVEEGHDVAEFVGGEHSLAEAREIFRNAAAVVAPHGGALLNMVFMRPGAVVVEIGYYERNAYQYNSMRFPPWYFVFAKHMRLNHWLVMAPGSYGGPIECPVDLTLDTLRAALP